MSECSTLCHPEEPCFITENGKCEVKSKKMNKIKHTPGPWKFEHSEDIDLPNHVAISANTHTMLAQVVWKMENDEYSPQCEANARLIAAAPDLLEALEAIIDSGELPLCYSSPLVIKANKAIAKAKEE